MNNRRERKTLRLKGYDYSSPGAYFVTTCTFERECLFGEIINGEMRLNTSGEIVKNVWEELPKRFDNIKVDNFVIMPNHMHGLFQIMSKVAERNPKSKRKGKVIDLSEIIRAFKSLSAKRVNIQNDSKGTPLWQRSFYDRIIRDDDQLHAAIQYIQDNPINWHEDEDNIW